MGRVVPRSRRAAREVLPQWQGLSIRDLIPDYGGQDATVELVETKPARHLVYRSTRGRIDRSWAIMLSCLEAAVHSMTPCTQ